jgi:hypothetical protein
LIFAALEVSPIPLPEGFPVQNCSEAVFAIITPELFSEISKDAQKLIVQRLMNLCGL